MVYRLTAGDTAGAVADARLTPGQWSLPVLAAFAHDSAAIRAMEAAVGVAQAECNGIAVVYLLWTGRREQAVQLSLGPWPGCESPVLGVRWALRLPVLAPLAGDPRIQALRAETERFLARARWR